MLIRTLFPCNGANPPEPTGCAGSNPAPGTANVDLTSSKFCMDNALTPDQGWPHLQAGSVDYGLPPSFGDVGRFR